MPEFPLCEAVNPGLGLPGWPRDAALERRLAALAAAVGVSAYGARFDRADGVDFRNNLLDTGAGANIEFAGTVGVIASSGNLFTPDAAFVRIGETEDLAAWSEVTADLVSRAEPPVLRDGPAGDHRLRFTSPCVGKREAALAEPLGYTHDIDGRPISARPECGAFEWAPGG